MGAYRPELSAVCHKLGDIKAIFLQHGGLLAVAHITSFVSDAGDNFMRGIISLLAASGGGCLS